MAAAIASFSRALELNSRNINSLNNLAVIHFQAGDTLQTEALLRQAQEIAPNHPDVKQNLRRLKSGFKV